MNTFEFSVLVVMLCFVTFVIVRDRKERKSQSSNPSSGGGSSDSHELKDDTKKEIIK